MLCAAAVSNRNLERGLTSKQENIPSKRFRFVASIGDEPGWNGGCALVIFTMAQLSLACTTMYYVGNTRTNFDSTACKFPFCLIVILKIVAQVIVQEVSHEVCIKVDVAFSG